MSSIFEMYMNGSYIDFNLTSIMSENDNICGLFEGVIINEGFDFKAKFKNFINKILKAIDKIIEGIKRIIRKFKTFNTKKHADLALSKLNKLDLGNVKIKDALQGEVKESAAILETSKDYMNRLRDAGRYAIEHSEDLLLSEVTFANNYFERTTRKNVDQLDQYKKSLLPYLKGKKLDDEGKSVIDLTGSASDISNKVKDTYSDYKDDLDKKLKTKSDNMRNFTFEDVLRYCKKGTDGSVELLGWAEDCLSNIRTSIKELDDSTDSWVSKAAFRLLSAYHLIDTIFGEYIILIHRCNAAQTAFIRLVEELSTVDDNERDKYNSL